KIADQPIRIDREERLGPGQPGEAMPTEAPEADAGRQRSLDSGLRLAGDDDLASMRRPADPSRCVQGQTDVPRIGQGGTAAVDPGSDPAFQIVQPGPGARRAP